MEDKKEAVISSCTENGQCDAILVGHVLQGNNGVVFVVFEQK
jgi:hypothetical protein